MKTQKMKGGNAVNDKFSDIFVKTYNDTYDYICKYLALKFNCRELIEDALQSVYLDFYRALINTEGKIRNPKHYILRIAKRYVADHYKDKEKNTFEDIDSLDIPDDKMLRKLENADFFDYEQVMGTLKKADELTYRIFVLHYQYGYTIKKTAAITKLPQSTVKSKIYRMLDKLKKTYCENSDNKKNLEKEDKSYENDRDNGSGSSAKQSQRA